MNFEATIERIYEHLESDEVEKAVMACLRLARKIRDYPNAAMFLRELYPERDEVVRVLNKELAHLKDDAIKLVVDWSAERWIESHTSDFPILPDPENQDKRVLKKSIGEIEDQIEQFRLEIVEQKVPTGMGEYDTAAFTDRMDRERSVLRLQLQAFKNIKSKVKSRCLSFASEIEGQLEAQSKTVSVLADIQTQVNNYFKPRSSEVYDKLVKASHLSSSSDVEDAALLLTSVRRAVHAVADHFYPPADGTVICHDGRERKLGPEQYLNRLHEFVFRSASGGTAFDLLKAELELMIAYLKRLNDLASKGVHASVSNAEAKQGLIGLYFFLSNLIALLETKNEQSPNEQVKEAT